MKGSQHQPSEHYRYPVVRRSFLTAPLAWAPLAWAPLAWAPIAWATSARAQLAIPPSLLERGSALLADLIRSTRETAIANGVRPVPARIQRALLGYFPDAVLRKVRYMSGSADAITIPGLALTYGHIDAITLGDVILFREDRAALNDSKLWAHELTHVMQYERWGIEGFAKRYLQDHEAVEREARDNADRYVAWSEHARL